MAIEISEFKLPITPMEARNFIQNQTDSFGVFYDMDRSSELIAIFSLEMRKIEAMAKRTSGLANLHLGDKNSMMRSLMQLGVPESTFYPIDKSGKQAKSASLNVDVENAILNNPLLKPVVKETTLLYQKHKKFQNTTNKLVKRVQTLPQSVVLSKNGHRMLVAHPQWDILSTSRIQASNPNVQQIDRVTPEVIIEPKGYTLVRADSAQIEPCINFSYFLRDELIMNLIIRYQDAYFGLWRYCMMSLAEEQAAREDFERNYQHIEVNDEIKEQRQSIKRLTNAGSYGSEHLDDVIPELADAYDRKLVNHPARLAFEERVRDAVNKGETTFYGAFGTPVTPGETEKYTPGEGGWKNHLIRCGINNPVQTTASELMMFSVNKAKGILQHAKDTHVCFYKHDEACFYVSDADIKDGILEELKDITAYSVKGWVPIKCEMELGVKHGKYPTYIL